MTRSNWANATHVCTCEVDIATGLVTLLRYIAVEDCGAMINPNIVEGQIAGGTAQGIAGVLYEHLAYDDDGNPVATTFMDYLVPTAAEIPRIEFGHVDTPGPGPGGYKGVGEGGVLGARACGRQRGRGRARTARRHRQPAAAHAVVDLRPHRAQSRLRRPTGVTERTATRARAGSRTGSRCRERRARARGSTRRLAR